MEFGLKGRHVAVLVADGVDAAGLGGPRRALDDAGAAVDLLGAHRGEVRAAGGEALGVDRTIEECRATDYDALVIPGGRRAADALGTEQRAVQLVKEFMAADKPVAALDDGVRLLIAADAVAGRPIAAGPELVEEVRAAGGEVVNEPLRVDAKLITARGGEAPELGATIVREFGDRVDEARVDQLSEQSFPASDPPPGPVAVGGEGASTALHLDGRSGDPSRPSTDEPRP